MKLYPAMAGGKALKSRVTLYTIRAQGHDLLKRIDNRAPLSLSHLPAGVVGQIQDRLTFLNPAHQEAERRGFYTGNISRQIRGYRLNDGRDRLVIPRGFTAQLVAILRGAGIPVSPRGDQRLTLPPVDFTFTG